MTINFLRLADLTAAERAQLLKRTENDLGPYLAGTPYRGDDPLLQLWVLATLLDSVLAAYEHLVRPLARTEKHAYYHVGQRLGRAFGIPAELMPPTYDDFECYVDAMLDSDALTVGPAAREVVAALFAPIPLGPVIRLGSFMSLGLTAPRLREAFGLPWTPAHERRFQRLGIYEWRDVYAAAKNDVGSDIVAFRFRMTERFKNPVDMKVLESIGIRGPFMSPRKITDTQFACIYSKGTTLT